jgi:SCF-associated factor 1
VRGADSFVIVLFKLFREKENGRLGLSTYPRTTLSDVSYPVELHIPGVQLVRLAASGR